MKIIHGIGVSNGIAIGKSYPYVFKDVHINVNEKKKQRFFKHTFFF